MIIILSATRSKLESQSSTFYSAMFKCIHIHCTVNVLKFRAFSLPFLDKRWLPGMEFIKCLSEKQSGKPLIRLLLQKQSDLCLLCLSRFFGQTTVFTVRNFRTFTIHVYLNHSILFPLLFFHHFVVKYYQIFLKKYNDL